MADKHEDTPHWDTPYGTAEPGSTKNKVVGLVVLLGIVLCCMGGMIAWSLTKSDDDTPKKTDIASQFESGEQPKTGEPSAASQEKNEDIRKLTYSISKLKSVIKRKLAPTIARFKADRTKIRTEVKRLAKVQPRSKVAKKLRLYIGEYKELSKMIGGLESKMQGFEEKVLELEQAKRRVRRRLQVAEFLDEDEKKKLERLIAKSDLMIEKAEEEKHSLDGAMGATKTEAKTTPKVNDADLDKILGGEKDSSGGTKGTEIDDLLKD